MTSPSPSESDLHCPTCDGPLEALPVRGDDVMPHFRCTGCARILYADLTLGQHIIRECAVPHLHIQTAA